MKEDSKQRFNYFLKQYGEGYLDCNYFDYVLFDGNDNDCDYDTYNNEDIVVVALWEDTNENIISKKIFGFIENDLYDYLGLDVSSSYVKQNCFITGNAICVVVRFNWDRTSADYDDAKFSLENLNEYAEVDPNGEYSMSAAYGFELNGKTVRGKDLALLLGIENIG
jgi:hypothetical protein